MLTLGKSINLSRVRAYHDLLVSMVAGPRQDVAVLWSDAAKASMAVQLGTLCWVLGCSCVDNNAAGVEKLRLVIGGACDAAEAFVEGPSNG